MIWYDCIVPMYPHHGLTAQDFDDMLNMYLIYFEDELFGHNWLESYATELLDAKHQWTDNQDVLANQHHLTAKKKCNLLDVLQQHQKLFDGSLGVYSYRKVHIDIDPNTKPEHVHPYPVPQIKLWT
jgi:hypothetical protein